MYQQPIFILHCSPHKLDKCLHKTRIFVHIGPAIKDARKKKQWTQKDLADYTATSVKFISNIEQGKSTAQLDKVFDLIRTVGLTKGGEAMKKFLVVLASFIVLTGCSGTIPDLGIINGELTPCPKTANCVNSQAADEKHHIQPIRYAGTRAEARTHLLQIFESEKRTKILVAQESYIRAEFTSALFRFVDDMEFYLTEGQAGETIIHCRSSSRVGSSDLGVNRKRIERVRSKF